MNPKGVGVDSFLGGRLVISLVAGSLDPTGLTFIEADFDTSQWGSVDGSLQLAAPRYGVPLYTNITYPFVKDPPRVTGTPPIEFTSYRWRNQVGSYRRTFRIPDAWSNRTVFLRFDGVDSAYYVG